MKERIASLEMLPDTEPLPHLICSRLIFGSGGGDELAMKTGHCDELIQNADFPATLCCAANKPHGALHGPRADFMMRQFAMR